MMSRCWVMCLIGLVLVLFGRCIAEAQATPDRMYGERTLPEWRRLIKSKPADALADQEVVHGLMEIVADPRAKWADRRNFALTLGRIGAPARDAVPLLRNLLNSNEEDAVSTRLWALKSLGLMGTPAAAATAEVAVIASNREETFMVRAVALETLARIGIHDPLALATLLDVLKEDRNHKDPRDANEIRRAAVEALSLLGPAATPAIPELLRALGSDWGLLQLSAATALGGLGSRGEMAIPALADQILFCENGEVREAAADALGQIGPRSLPILEQFLQDSDPSVRRLAIRGLVAEGDNEAAPALLIHGLSDEDAGNRTAAATALFHREQPSPEVWGVLLTALGSRERNVRISAYRTLQTRPKDLASHRGRLLELSQNRLAPVQSQEAARRLLELCPE